MRDGGFTNRYAVTHGCSMAAFQPCSRRNEDEPIETHIEVNASQVTENAPTSQRAL